MSDMRLMKRNADGTVEEDELHLGIDRIRDAADQYTRAERTRPEWARAWAKTLSDVVDDVMPAIKAYYDLDNFSWKKWKERGGTDDPTQIQGVP